MEYRVIELSHQGMRELGVFESAYDAVDHIVSEARSDEARALRMYVVDDENTRLFGPTDLIQVSDSAIAA